MKVLHVIPAVAARYGGPSEAVVAMCRALMERGVETRIVTTDADGPRHRLPVPLRKEIDWRGVPTLFFPRSGGESFKFSPSLARWLDRELGKFDFVHIHAVFSHCCWAAARAAGQREVPYAVRPLGSLEPWSLRQRSLRKRLFLALFGRRALEAAAFVHYTSDRERVLTQQALGLGRGVVVPLGVENRGPSPPGPVPYSQPYLLSLGRFHPKKGLEGLIEAFERLNRRPELEQWTLVLAGDGPPGYRSELDTLAAASGARIVFAGWLEGGAKTRALEGASLAAFPSYQENFGIAVAESLAAGVPVVVTEAVGLAGEVRAANAGWVTGASRSDLTATLFEAMTELAGPRAQSFREAAHQLGARYRWEVSAERLEALYRTALSAASTRSSLFAA